MHHSYMVCYKIGLKQTHRMFEFYFNLKFIRKYFIILNIEILQLKVDAPILLKTLINGILVVLEDLLGLLYHRTMHRK